MGLTGNLTRILLGIGLGILAVSCLTVTICFAKCANKFYPSDLLKLGAKISYDYKNDLYSCCIAITVLGCFSAVAAIASIALSIILEGQTLILIIVGGVSALFAFGCIVAEGMFTQRSVKSLSMHSGNFYDFYENSEPYYRNYRTNKEAQDYIKDSIQTLWEQAYFNFHSLYSRDDIPRFSEIYQKIGSDDPDISLTYADLWKTNIYYCGSNSQFLYFTGSYIAMCYNQISMPVASVKFNYSKSAKIKRRICWPNSKQTDYDCKDFSSNEEIYAECNIYDDVPRLNEYIISGHYYENDRVNYEVKDFPVAFELLSSRELKDVSNADSNARKAIFPDSYRHHKITGKKCAEASWKDEKNYKPNKLERQVYISPYKVNSWKEYLDKCENDEDFECDEPVSERKIIDDLNSINKDYNKGKSTSKTSKFYDGASRTILNDLWLNCYLLYNLALINLIIQIFGIVFWACGRFLGFALGGSDEKTPSDGEGAA